MFYPLGTVPRRYKCIFVSDLSATGAAVLHVDRGFDSRVARHIPQDVGLQARVRRGGPPRRAPQDLLDHSITF